MTAAMLVTASFVTIASHTNPQTKTFKCAPKTKKCIGTFPAPLIGAYSHSKIVCKMISFAPLNGIRYKDGAVAIIGIEVSGILV